MKALFWIIVIGGLCLIVWSLCVAASDADRLIHGPEAPETEEPHESQVDG